MRSLLLILVVTLSACSRAKRPEDGVYVAPKEVFAVHSEILELTNGRYRYWFLGDVGTKAPLEKSGKYTRQGDRILFSGTRDEPSDRLLVQDAGAARLLRSDAEVLWIGEKKLLPYGTLTRVPHAFEAVTPPRDFDKAKWIALLEKLPRLQKPQ